MDLRQRCLGCMEDKGSNNTCPYCGWVEGTPAESALHLPPGTVLAEKYLLGRVLGQGGFGITYLAWDTFLDRKLAVKEFFPRDYCYRETGQVIISIYSGTNHEQYSYGLDKFLAEGKTLARFDGHPNIVSVKDFFKANDTAYLVMNYLEGDTLCSHLLTRGEKLAYDEILQVIMPVLDALKAIHEEGLLHRDISPDNIMITSQGRVVILDFGAARHALGEKGHKYSIVIKPGYAPEEQYRSTGNQGPWTDIYAVAATIYRSLTGLMPPDALDRLNDDNLISPTALGLAIPKNHERALLKALSIKADNRYQSVAEFQNELFSTPASDNSISTLQEEQDLTVSCRDYQAENIITGSIVTEGTLPDPGPLEHEPGQASELHVSIGRATSNDIVLTDNTVSRQHASITHRDGSWYINDLNSTHGTYVEGRAVKEPTPLPAGVWISISAFSIFFDGQSFFSGEGVCLFNGSDLLNDRSKIPGQVEQPSIKAPYPSKRSSLKPLLLIALAASVIAMAIMVANNIRKAEEPTPTTTPAAEPAATTFPDAAEISSNTVVEALETGNGREIATIEYDNGVYTGQVKNGVPDGYGVFIYRTSPAAPGSHISTVSERKYEGYWKDGKKHGEGKMTYPEGLTRKGTWENGIFTSN